MKRHFFWLTALWLAAAPAAALGRGGGGCFLPDTRIRKADGSQAAIAALRPGDRLSAFTADGEVVSAEVRRVLIRQADEHRIVRAGDIVLHVTAEHPFYVGHGAFTPLETLTVGETIFVYDGHALRPQAIESIEAVQGPVRVYNLQTDAPHTFFANGVAVHNKGGGGGGRGGGGGSRGGGGFRRSSSSRSGSGSSDAPPWVFLLIGGGIVAVVLALKYAARHAGENLDFVYSPAQVAKKADKTARLLEFLAKQDPAMAADALRQQAQATFLKLQECWQQREFSPMQPLLVADLYKNLCRQLAGMVRQHEINVLEDLRIDRIDLVNVRYTLKDQQREFTALITATARDYYIDDRTRRRLRGDSAPAQFQEFWTFQYQDKKWLLREIEQTRESDALKDENFFEQFTDQGVEQIYGPAAPGEGPAGPWLQKQAQTKETRIERMLAFLVQTDKLWDRQAMLETTRRIFLAIMAARESGDAAELRDDDLFPELAADLKAELAANRARGTQLQFRNLCVRKVELVLARNFSDNARDEFIARVRAHAQRVVTRGGQVTSQDEDVTPFEQYLTLGRHDGRWKLKEFLTARAGQAAAGGENLDEDSSPEQVQWYYKQKRAL